MVREKGLEPLILTAADFKSAVYTNSTTPAKYGSISASHDALRMLQDGQGAHCSKRQTAHGDELPAQAATP